MTKRPAFIARLLAVTAMALPAPVAAGSVRSADALPVAGSSVVALQSSGEDEDYVRCVEIDDDFVKVDESGRVLLDSDGEPFGCSIVAAAIPPGAPVGAAAGAGDGSGIFGLGALANPFVAALVGTFAPVLALVSGGNDSPG